MKNKNLKRPLELETKTRFVQKKKREKMKHETRFKKKRISFYFVTPFLIYADSTTQSNHLTKMQATREHLCVQTIKEETANFSQYVKIEFNVISTRYTHCTMYVIFSCRGQWYRFYPHIFFQSWYLSAIKRLSE